jgi:tetratricopeptide (TPR) repeat protein
VNADAIVLGHNTVSRSVSDNGELRLGFRRQPDARVVSERAFRLRLGLLSAAASSGQHSEDQVARRAGLGAAQLRTLTLFDVLAPVDGRYSYADLVAARAAGRLHAAGVTFPKIIAAAIALERRGESLSSVRLAEAPWGEVLRILEGTLMKIDGQLLLPLEGSDLDADGAFALAEEREREGDLVAAKRWYELAARLDSADPVIPFNLGNVLDELGLAREAEIAYRQAIGRGPDMADAWFNLGVLQEKTGRETQALAAYERAFAIDPAYADALHNAALLLIRDCRFAAAADLLERILSTSPARAAEIRRLVRLCRLEARSAAARE